MDAREDSDDQAGKADGGQPAATVRARVFADEATVREWDVIDRRRQADDPATDVQEQRPGQECESHNGEQNGEANEDISDGTWRLGLRRRVGRVLRRRIAELVCASRGCSGRLASRNGECRWGLA